MPTKEVKALGELIRAKNALWVAWDVFEKAIGKKVCKRTEPDADRAVSNLVIAGRKITEADVSRLRTVIAWEPLGEKKVKVLALTDAAVQAVKDAVRTAASVCDAGRPRTVDVEGSDEGEGVVGGSVGSAKDADDDTDDVKEEPEL